MLSGLKAKIKRLFTAKYGKNVFVARGVDITNCQFEEYVNLAHDASVMNSRIGKRTSVGRYTIIRNSEIGRYVSLSWRCTIGADAHPYDRISGSGAFYQKKYGLLKENAPKDRPPVTVVGNDVWIGCDVIIVAGVKVGDGAIIGAGSVVTKDVPPYAIVAGVPAKIIRYRFDEETQKQLLASKWWEFDDETYRKNISLFMKPVDEEILKELGEISQD